MHAGEIANVMRIVGKSLINLKVLHYRLAVTKRRPGLTRPKKLKDAIKLQKNIKKLI